MTARRIVWMGVVLVALAQAVAAQPQEPRLERVLAALAPWQVEAFADGAPASAIVLADGRTLEELLAAAENEASLAFTPLAACTLLRTAGSAAGALQPGQTRAFAAHGNLRAQGGPLGGCGVPAEARALAVVVRAIPSGQGSLRFGPADRPLTGLPALEYAAATTTVGPVLVELCSGDACAAAFQARAAGAAAHVVVSLVGFFAPLQLTQGPPGEQGPTGPVGPPGLPGETGANGADGAQGADGTARAYAYVHSHNQVPCSPACTFDRAKGITGVTHPAMGTYCINAPGIDSASVSAVVTVESGGTAGTEGNASAMIEANGPDCPSGQFEVITERQPITAVRNAADTGSVNVAGNAEPADDPSFMILIP